jgi:hypothetical protein
MVGFAQSSETALNNISLSVILPDNSEFLSQKALSKIESKIQHIVSKNGISGRGYSNEFLIYPKFDIFDEAVVEGMRNLVVVEVEFNLYIQQYSTKKVFSSYSKSLRGSGFSKAKAIVDAISKISSSDPRMEEFIATGKERILTYYQNNCDQIAGDADALISMKKYQQAIALLSSVPKVAKDCYASIQGKSIDAYNAYQLQRCSENVLKAKAELANNSYTRALRVLSLVDPSSTCAAEAESLIKNAAGKVDAKEQKEWNFMLKRYEDRQNMERYRLDTMEEIAKAYYRSKPQTVIYKSLF